VAPYSSSTVPKRIEWLRELCSFAFQSRRGLRAFLPPWRLTPEFTGPPCGLGFQENPGSAAPVQLLLGVLSNTSDSASAPGLGIFPSLRTQRHQYRALAFSPLTHLRAPLYLYTANPCSHLTLCRKRCHLGFCSPSLLHASRQRFDK
jgi:hypothetical protein